MSNQALDFVRDGTVPAQVFFFEQGNRRYTGGPGKVEGRRIAGEEKVALPHEGGGPLKADFSHGNDGISAESRHQTRSERRFGGASR